MRRNIRLAIVTVVATAALVAGSAASANAVTYSSGGVLRATATYSKGTLSLTDNASDGYGARSRYASYPSGGIFSYSNFDNSSGAGTTQKVGFLTRSDYKFTYNACIKDGSTTIACSAFVTVAS